MGKRCLIVANPVSGLGFGRRKAPKLKRLLEGKGLAADLVWTTGPDAAREAAAEADPAETAAILCVGGDGTVHEVVNGIRDRQIPVGVFPTGTGNILAKEYDVPYDEERVVDVVLRGHTKVLDVAEIDGRRLILFAGAGFDAYVAEQVARRREGRISKLSYIRPSLHALRSYAFANITVTVDDQALGRGPWVLVANVRHYGGPFAFLDEADPTDGRLDVCLLQGHRRRDLVRYLWARLRGSIRSCDDARFARGTRVRLESEAPVPLQIDGEYAGTLPTAIELLPARVPLLIP
jgi:YegS/Rv2252/BmrU family lipid kinase